MFISFIIAFLINLRFPRNRSITTIINERYGNVSLQQFRSTEKILYKEKKLNCDLEFLKACRSYEVAPKFIRFKLFNRNLENTECYILEYYI